MKYRILTNRIKGLQYGDVVEDDGKFNYEALHVQGEALKIPDKIKKERRFKIGLKTFEHIRGEKDVASDRIRMRWIAEADSDNFELYRDDTEYDVVIYACPDNEEANDNSLKVYDICDNVWENNDIVKNFISKMDKIIVASDGLKEDLEKITDKPVYVVGDGHNILKRVKKVHRGEAKKAVWFGYSDNAIVLDDFRKPLKDNGYKLTCVSESKIDCDKWIKWDEYICLDTIRKSDIAILPFKNKYKTNNKDVTAWLCGIPVAKTVDDLKTLKAGKARNEQLKQVDFSLYDIKDRANELLCAVS